MAGMSSDLDVLKDIPGYKAILKSVLKSQIQLLIEQLSDHTGEETIILTASVDDGTLSHLGSCTGKGFLNGRDEIKSQFLAFCLKSHHRKKTSEASLSPYQRPQSGQNERTASTHGLTNKRQRVQPVSLQRAGTGDTSGNSFTPTDMHLVPSQFLGANGQDSSRVNVKLESHEQPGASTTDSASASFSTNISLPSSIQLSHTQTAAESCVSDSNAVGNNDDVTEQGSENDDSGATSIKIEPITENEMELEITGVEPGNTSVPVESWNPVPGTNSVGEGASNEAGDQSGYKGKQFQPVQLIPCPPTTREPVILLQAITDQDPVLTTPTDVKITPTHDLSIQSSFTTMLTSFDYGTSQNLPSTSNNFSQDTPAEQISQSGSSTSLQNIPKPAPSTFSSVKSTSFGPTPIPLSGNERIVLPTCANEQYLPFTKENYGKEKDKWILKRHICQYCGKRCMKPSDLSRHIKTHTGECPFQCPVCKKRFREKFMLNAHFKKGTCTT